MDAGHDDRTPYKGICPMSELWKIHDQLADKPFYEGLQHSIVQSGMTRNANEEDIGKDSLAEIAADFAIEGPLLPVFSDQSGDRLLDTDSETLYAFVGLTWTLYKLGSWVDAPRAFSQWRKKMMSNPVEGSQMESHLASKPFHDDFLLGDL
ncbi:hypothetical protein BC832DRAFT_560869 [Gaertneriomyces semiglobifer]|nr:hypothetical protein BC832DRAFT_560869 [Gaertneriomyces semiglobifer]